eukprot:CAMPEP_0194320062 /NCGR_PEP_ID=MMETSP0171-20130528/16446_1 /TAXON_ID=218684 /ORGANISM="Corethron pennatum, Strain L29A3" /LENGTH=283 /DNA_ID=CAMNT_0039077493 /DNA_START=1 /DNA_END=852 /DNA_ORIENTATION=-
MVRGLVREPASAAPFSGTRRTTGPHVSMRRVPEVLPRSAAHAPFAGATTVPARDAPSGPRGALLPVAASDPPALSRGLRAPYDGGAASETVPATVPASGIVSLGPAAVTWTVLYGHAAATGTVPPGRGGRAATTATVSRPAVGRGSSGTGSGTALPLSPATGGRGVATGTGSAVGDPVSPGRLPCRGCRVDDSSLAPAPALGGAVTRGGRRAAPRGADGVSPSPAASRTAVGIGTSVQGGRHGGRVTTAPPLPARSPAVSVEVLRRGPSVVRRPPAAATGETT